MPSRFSLPLRPPLRSPPGLLARVCVAAFMLFGAIAWHGGAAAQAQQARNGKIVFDLTNGNAKQMLGFLQVIEETRATMAAAGMKPELVLAFRGPASRLVQTDMSKIPPEDHETAQKIAATVTTLRGSAGVRGIEQCNVAVRLLGLKPEHVLKDVTVVANSWLTIADYQAKGYAYIQP